MTSATDIKLLNPTPSPSKPKKRSMVGLWLVLGIVLISLFLVLFVIEISQILTLTGEVNHLSPATRLNESAAD